MRAKADIIWNFGILSITYSSEIISIRRGIHITERVKKAFSFLNHLLLVLWGGPFSGRGIRIHGWTSFYLLALNPLQESKREPWAFPSNLNIPSKDQRKDSIYGFHCLHLLSFLFLNWPLRLEWNSTRGEPNWVSHCSQTREM